MKQIDFNLICHPANYPGPAIRIDGRIQRRHGQLVITYILHDPAGRIPIPRPVPAARSHGLWEHTCFECFIATGGAGDYWEINLSPAGPWNIYRFDDYRQGMREEAKIPGLAMTVAREETSLELRCALRLTPIAAPRQPIRVALSAVIQTVAGENSYWALSHPGQRPDFHHRDGFVLAL